MLPNSTAWDTVPTRVLLKDDPEYYDVGNEEKGVSGVREKMGK